MVQRLYNRKIGVRQAHVLPHHGDIDFACEIRLSIEERLKRGQIGLATFKAQSVEHGRIEALRMQVHGNLVDGRRIGASQHLFGAHVAEKRYLLARFVGDLVIGSAYDEIGLHAKGSKLLHRMLRRLRFNLVGSGNIRNKGHVHEQHLSCGLLLLELARGLYERLRFDVADGSAYFGNDDIGARLLGNAAQPLLDSLGYMRNDLHGATQEIAATLACDEALIDGALREVRLARKVLIDEALVMPQVEVTLMTVFGDEHLAVLKRRHSARIDVEIRIHLLHGHLVPARFEQMPQRRRRDALAQRRHYATRHEDVLCHESPFRLLPEKARRQQKSACRKPSARFANA